MIPNAVRIHFRSWVIPIPGCHCRHEHTNAAATLFKTAPPEKRPRRDAETPAQNRPAGSRRARRPRADERSARAPARAPDVDRRLPVDAGPGGPGPSTARPPGIRCRCGRTVRALSGLPSASDIDQGPSVRTGRRDRRAFGGRARAAAAAAAACRGRRLRSACATRAISSACCLRSISAARAAEVMISGARLGAADAGDRSQLLGLGVGDVGRRAPAELEQGLGHLGADAFDGRHRHARRAAPSRAPSTPSGCRCASR